MIFNRGGPLLKLFIRATKTHEQKRNVNGSMYLEKLRQAIGLWLLIRLDINKLPDQAFEKMNDNQSALNARTGLASAAVML
jgi:hypothetical protein